MAFPALSSLTGGGGLSTSSSSSTGAQGGDSFTQDFGGVNVNQSPWYIWAIIAAVVVGLALIAYKVFL